MSIRKSLMHYFDKASSKHIPFHPQTESAAITDWHESIIKSLASKVLPTVVSELTTDSVMGKLIKMLLNASGVKYSIDTNGYVCLGSFFGGLIIQWVHEVYLPEKASTITLPLAYPKAGLVSHAIDIGSAAASYGSQISGCNAVVVFRTVNVNGAKYYASIFSLGW